MGNSQPSSPKSKYPATISGHVLQPSSPTKVLPATSTIIKEIPSPRSPSKTGNRRSSLVSEYDNPELSGIVFGFVIGTPPKRDTLSNIDSSNSTVGRTNSAPTMMNSSTRTSSHSLYKNNRMVSSCKELKKNRIVPLQMCDTPLPKSNSMNALRERSERTRTRSSTLGSTPKSIATRTSMLSGVESSPPNSPISSNPSSPSSSLLFSLFSSPSSSGINTSGPLPPLSPLSIGVYRSTVPLIHVSKPEVPHTYEHLAPPIKEILNTKLDIVEKGKALRKASRDLALVK